MTHNPWNAEQTPDGSSDPKRVERVSDVANLFDGLGHRIEGLDDRRICGWVALWSAYITGWVVGWHDHADPRCPIGLSTARTGSALPQTL